MTVKVIKCSNTDYWYKNKIGEEYEVARYPSGRCKITIGEYQFCSIFEADYEIVKQ